jgi:hypothetical protein
LAYRPFICRQWGESRRYINLLVAQILVGGGNACLHGSGIPGATMTKQLKQNNAH